LCLVPVIKLVRHVLHLFRHVGTCGSVRRVCT
jgi:hypothetical protein